MNAHVRRTIELPQTDRAVFNMAGEVADIAGLTRTFEAHNTALSDRMAAMEAEIGRLNERNAALLVSGGNAAADGVVHPDIQSLGVFARGEFSEIRAAMTVGSDPDGGYTVLPEVERTILNIAHDISPLRDLARVVKIGGAEYVQIINPGVIPANWTGETDPRNETPSLKLVKVAVPAQEIYAMPAASQSLLDDSFTDAGAWLQNEIGKGIAIKEAAAFVSGSGVMQPRGFLSYDTHPSDDFARPKWDCIQHIPVGSATPTDLQLADGIIAVATKLRSPYRSKAKNPTWLLSRDMAVRLRQIKDSRNLYIWSEDGRLNGDIQPLLAGFPVAYSEDMPASAADACCLALASWSDAYTIVDRIGIRVLRDAVTAKPYVLFYTTKRVGGAVIDFNAIKLLKWSAT